MDFWISFLLLVFGTKVFKYVNEKVGWPWFVHILVESPLACPFGHKITNAT